MKMICRVFALLLVCLGPLATAGEDAHPASAAYSRTVTHQGTRIDLQVEHIDPGQHADSPFQVGENVRVRFKFTEISSGTPIRGASPAAWLDLTDPDRKTTPQQCIGKVKRLAEESTFSASEVDMNGNYVVSMNADPSIMVVDPRFAFGDARLLALIPLKAPGEDWTVNADGSRIYVSMPAADAVAVIDTNSWQVIANLSVPHHPTRIALQPDEEYLWVAFGAANADSGVTVFATRELKSAARILTGRGYHHIAFSDNSAYGFVTNPGSGSVSVIDIHRLAKIKDVPTGGSPSWIAWSDLAQAAYVSSESDGAIVAIGGKEHNLVARMAADPGLSQIRFAPGGRLALAINPQNDRVYVVDASVNRIIQTGKLEKQPNQLAFSSKMAYVRHRGSDSIFMIPLDSLGAENKPVSAGDFPGGEHPAGEMSVPTPADGLVHILGEAGVLVANPEDHAVYSYMEGMAAPSGSFSTYGREPRAVLEIERNLRERAPGTYETVVKLTRAGTYDLAMLLDKPQVVSCFDFSVMEDPRRVAALRPKLKIELLTPPRSVATGSNQDDKPVALRVRLLDAATSTPRTDIVDLTALIFSPGVWQRREIARHVGDGVYILEFQPPRAGHYNVYLAVPSLGMDFVQYTVVDLPESKH